MIAEEPETSFKLSPALISIASNNLSKYFNTQEKIWQIKKQSYNELKENPTLISSNNVLATFMNSVENSSIASYYEVDKLIQEHYYTKSDDYLQEASIINESVVPVLTPEFNYKIYNKINLYHLLNEASPISEDDKIALKQIAIQCPTIGGAVVYQVRSLINECELDPDLLYNNCMEAAQPVIYSEVIEEHNFDNKYADSSTSSSSTIFPNPAQHSIKINSNLSGKIEIYFSLEDSKLSKIFSPYETINFTNLDEGIYFYKLLFENSQIEVGKLIII